MVKHLLTSILLLCAFTLELSAQCECTDCAVVIPNNGTASSFLDISGATNNTLGSNGQSLCLICIELHYDAIQELDMVLISPSGSSVDLMVNTGIAVNDNITFEICFVPCSQSADPDPGFPAVFDTDAGYLPNQVYNGYYYPADGCLEDLSGDVNGEWELQMTDNVILDNGELIDWFMVFSDDAGIGCANSSECGVPNSCLADGGFLSGSAFITECEGDPSLDLDLPPTYNGGPGPPDAEYDYTYVIADASTDIVESITMDTDLTGFPPGAYQICGLSYLIDDESLLPSADGVLEVGDIEDQIDDDEYCADLSSGCTIVVIESLVMPPTVVGPLEVCAGVPEQWEITDYDPSLTYQLSVSMGSFSFFTFADGIATIEFLSGPGEICFIINSVCGDEETCLSIDVLPNIPEFEIIGEFDVCPGDVVIYDIEPEPGVGEQYIYTVTGGVITNQTTNSVTIEWSTVETTGELCVELDGAVCEIEILCEEIDIEINVELPDDFDSPSELCIGEIGESEINSDSDVLNYIWSGTNINILSGQGSNSIEYESLNAGIATVCLELETICGNLGPECEDITILEVPEPEIITPVTGCEFILELEAETDNGNTVEWEVISGPGNALFNPDDEPITTVEFSQSGIYEIAITESNAACETTDIIEVQIFENLIIENIDINCTLENEFIISFEIVNGTAPYSVDGDIISGNTFTSEPIDSGVDYSFEILDDIGCQSIIEGSFECPCLSDAGTMENETLRACISDDETVVAEWNEDGVLDFDDIGRFFLHDGEDDELGFVFSTNESGEFEYDDRLVPGTVYYISYVVGNELNNTVDLSDPCLSVSEGQPVIFYEDPVLDVIISGPDCNNSIQLVGTPIGEIIEINWTQVSGPGQSLISEPTSSSTTITIDQAGAYIFQYEIANSACNDFQTIEVDFPGLPILSGVIESCDNNSEFYQVSVSITGGIEPYTSNIPGNFDNNTFTSTPIATGENYNIIITDANGCASNASIGVKLCDCNTEAGLFPDLVLTKCGTEDSIVVDTTMNRFFDNNDIGIYYLHQQSIFNYTQVIDSSFNGVFYFNDNLEFLDTIYYISFVVGDNIGGIPDQTDACFDVSNSVSISWLSIDKTDAGEDVFICDNTVNLDAFPANGSWSILDTPLNASVIFENEFSPTSNITLDSIGTYSFIWQSNQSNCPASDTVEVTRYPLPIIVELNTICNDDLNTYNLRIELEQGGPFTINQAIFESTYGQTSIPSLDTFELLITNSFGCQSILIVEPIDCSCPSQIGTINTNELELCQTESIDLSVFNQDYVLGENDTLVYIIHDGNEQSIGNILGFYSDSESIVYETIFETNTIYFLNMLIAPVIDGEIMEDNTCSLYSESISFQWLNDNTISFDSEFEQCVGNTIEVEFDISDYYPVVIFLESSLGEVMELEIQDESSTIFEFEVSNSETIWNIVQAEGKCLDLQNSTFTIFGIEESVVQILPEVEICNNSLFGSILNLDDLFIDEPTAGIWEANNLPLVNNTIDFNTFDEGSYSLSFSTEGFVDPCPGSIYITQVNVLDCQCPEFDIQEFTLCNSQSSISLSSIDVLGFEGTWSITNASEFSKPIFVQNNNELIISDSDAGSYSLSYTIMDDRYPEECEDMLSTIVTIIEPFSSGEQIEIPSFCEDDNELIIFADYIDNQSLNGTWFFNGSPVSNSINTSLLSLGENIFTYITDINSPCESEELNFVINVEPQPQFEVIAEDILCFGDNDGSISIIIANGNDEEYSCYLNDILQSGDKTITGLGPGDYTIYIENDNCRSEVVEVSIQEPPLVSVSLGEDRLINIEEEITIRAITNILESDIEQVSWSDLSEIIGIDVLELRESFSNNTTIVVEVTDRNGCIAFDELKIKVIEPDIYIPNIFNPESVSNSIFGIGNPEALSVVNSFLIFDRWGNKIIDNSNVSPNDKEASWDGRFNDVPAEQGVYVYVYKITLINGEQRTLHGNVTLIR